MQLDRGVAVVGQHDVVAFAPQHDGQQFPHRQFIVDDENASRTRLGGDRFGFLLGRAHVVTSLQAGRCTDTRVPIPLRDMISISPLYSVTVRCTIASPNPLPFAKLP